MEKILVHSTVHHLMCLKRKGMITNPLSAFITVKSTLAATSSFVFHLLCGSRIQRACLQSESLCWDNGTVYEISDWAQESLSLPLCLALSYITHTLPEDTLWNLFYQPHHSQAPRSQRGLCKLNPYSPLHSLSAMLCREWTEHFGSFPPFKWRRVT